MEDISDMSDAFDIYAARRSSAIALWLSKPPEDFYMASWQCGTTACALGWLAVDRHDGWVMDGEYRAPKYLPLQKCNPLSVCQQAAVYFGLTEMQALNLFVGCSFEQAWFYGKPLHQVTAKEVCLKLMEMPYTHHTELKFTNAIDGSEIMVYLSDLPSS